MESEALVELSLEIPRDVFPAVWERFLYHLAEVDFQPL